jgi:hypothetical protein
LKKIDKSIDVALSVSHTADEHVDERELTAYERARLERERAFDERISRFSGELDNYRPIERKGTVAEELHPAVHNLPHDAVNVWKNTLPDVEVSE